MTWRSDTFKAWFVEDRSESGDGTYQHLLLTEASECRETGLLELRRLAYEAHRDAAERINNLMGISLDPLGPDDAATDNSLHYPDALSTTTLQGYLGEVFAGLIAENFDPHGQRWVVPAFLFSTHTAAVQALERRRQLGGPAKPIPGRTGDDALAFVRDQEGRIVTWLFGEAKCSHDHDAALITAAHEQLSAAFYRPVDLVALIDILQGKGDPESLGWAEALQLLLFASESEAPPRFDLLVYVCGRSPRRNATWIAPAAASAHYTGGRQLEAVEVHLSDFDAVLVAAYPTHVVAR